MKQRTTLCKTARQFNKFEKRVIESPDENECQVILLELVGMATGIEEEEAALASKFESYWLDFRDKIKELSDSRIYNDAKKEIEDHLSSILDPERVIA